MATTLNVLVIEDSEEDTLLMVRELTKAGYSVKFEQAHSAATLAAALAKGGWDIIFSDRRVREPVALLVMDLNGFKAINDSLGHHAGDCVLQRVAARLSGVIREADTLARLGGDEFAFILPRTDGEGGMVAARKFLHSLKEPILFEESSLMVTGSIGIAWFPEHGATGEALLQKADI